MLGGLFGRARYAATMWGGAGKTMFRGLNPYAQAAIGGAGVGGAYGAMSDNTSVLGGALGGAAIGAGGLFTGRFVNNMAGYYGVNLGGMVSVSSGVEKATGLASKAVASAKNIGGSLASNTPVKPVVSSLKQTRFNFAGARYKNSKVKKAIDAGLTTRGAQGNLF